MCVFYPYKIGEILHLPVPIMYITEVLHYFKLDLEDY